MCRFGRNYVRGHLNLGPEINSLLGYDIFVITLPGWLFIYFSFFELTYAKDFTILAVMCSTQPGICMVSYTLIFHKAFLHTLIKMKTPRISERMQGVAKKVHTQTD